jgi:hypothetical protein
VPFVWTKEHETRFQELKFKLVTAPTLAFPDFTRPFKVDTDACEYGIGAVKSENDGVGKPVAYFSRSLNKAERKYHTTEKEALAIVAAVRQFRPYLHGHFFTKVTDHKPLKWLDSFKIHLVE